MQRRCKLGLLFHFHSLSTVSGQYSVMVALQKNIIQKKIHKRLVLALFRGIHFLPSEIFNSQNKFDFLQVLRDEGWKHGKRPFSNIAYKNQKTVTRNTNTYKITLHTVGQCSKIKEKQNSLITVPEHPRGPVSPFGPCCPTNPRSPF